MAANGAMKGVVDIARAWMEGDPDPDTRQEMEALLEEGRLDELRARCEGSLTFGTAGIRGEVGAGPNRMNRAVVIQTTAGLAAYLIEQNQGPPGTPVVVGFDARPTSRQFAEDTVGVLAAAGIEVVYFPEPTPTPIVAFAAKHLGAAAAVVVTASHNPPADNGYKVYAANAAQIIPPMDAAIAAAIEEAGQANSIPRVETAFGVESDAISRADDGLFDEYWRQVHKARPDPQQSSLQVVYTPLHGVGGRFLEDLFARAGHAPPVRVDSQFAPDGTFPTVDFPNPEEPGALDLALKQANEIGADLVLANDPDADRLAAVVPYEAGWRPLSGNEMGVLLGDYVLRHHSGPERPIVVNSIVSSPMLGHLALHRSAHHEVTLTGFKWIVNAGLALEAAGVGRFVFGYEEALGYTVGSTVRDKDGISAALVFCDLVTGLARSEQTVWDRLSELWALVGLWASAQHSVVRSGPEGPGVIADAVRRLADSPPSHIGAYPVEEVRDYRTGSDRRPPWLGAQSLVELSLGDRGRALVRPSGTEPKLKIYVDLGADAGPGPLLAQRELEAEAVATAEQLAGSLGLS